MGNEALRSKDAVSQSYLLRCQLAIKQFKICPVCDSVNVLDNTECFACRWAGAFVFEPNDIESRLYEMISRCPGLLEVLVDDRPEPKTNALLRMWAAVLRFGKRTDVSA